MGGDVSPDENPMSLPRLWLFCRISRIATAEEKKALQHPCRLQPEEQPGRNRF